MSEAQTSATNEAGQGKKVKPSTLKIVVNKTHVGPVAVNGSRASKRLTKSANKIRLDHDLRISRVQNPEAPEKPSTSYSVLLGDEGVSMDPATALLAMEIWDRKYPSPGSKNYVSKSNELSTARAEAYAELGIIPRSDRKKKPTLTEEQKVAYNAKLSKFAFDYWEVRLSYKAPGKKAVRSHTYRTLNEPNIDKIFENLSEGVNKLQETIKVTVE